MILHFHRGQGDKGKRGLDLDKLQIYKVFLGPDTSINHDIVASV